MGNLINRIYIPEEAIIECHRSFVHGPPEDDEYAYCPDWKNAHYGIAKLGPRYRPIDPFYKFSAQDPDGNFASTLKYPVYGTFIAVAATMFHQAVANKPVWSQAWKHVGTSLIMITLSYAIIGYSERKAALRDATLKHYMELHPDRFPEIERHKVGHVMKNWMLNRKVVA